MTATATAMLLAAAPGAAVAGRTPFAWLPSTEVLPERGAEIVTWLAEENGKPVAEAPALPLRDLSIWWAGVLGVTDRLELAFPVELLRRDEGNGEPPGLRFSRYGIEARYRFVSSDPVDAPRLVPLARLAVKRDLGIGDRVRTEAGLALSYQCGRVLALVSAEAVAELGEDPQLSLRPGLGVGVAVTDELRLGVEGRGTFDVRTEVGSWVAAGPSASWTHGRFWIAGSLGIGLWRIDTAPRVVWGLLF